MRGQKIGDASTLLLDDAANVPAIGGSGGLYVLERDAPTGVFGTDRAAQEGIAVEDPDLANIARMVTASPT